MRDTRHSTPLDLELDHDTVDLTAAAATKYPSKLIDARKYFIFTAVINVIRTGAVTVGAFKLTLDVLEKDKSTVLWSQDFATAIDATVDGQQEVYLFGAGALAAKSAGSSGTLGADADVFKQAEYMKLTIEVVTQSDAATANTAELHLLLEG